MSKKVKYYYDSESLAYRKIKTKKGKKFGYAALFLVASALFGFLFFLLFNSIPFLELPKNKAQNRDLAYLQLHYSILDKKIEDLNEVASDLEDRDNNLYRTYFNSAPILDNERVGIIDKNRYKELEGFNNSQLVVKTSEKVDELSRKLAFQSKSMDEILALAKEKDKMLAAIPAIQPVKNEDLKRMASGFGYRSDPFTKVRKMHQGMDFTAATGSPIYATGDGVIDRADAAASGFGNHVVINHGYGYETLYAHMSQYNCTVGQHVKRGDIIGFVGSTGRSEGPHCHYEVHKDGEVVNPINFYYGNISAAEYIAISKIANQENQSFD